MADFCLKLPRPEYKVLKRISSNNSWFELYKIAPGVTAIYEPFQWQEVISYLIEGENRALLFDSGNGIADISGVVKQLTNKPVSVLNSHTHYDHVGGNFSFKTIYGMDTLFTTARQTGHPNEDIAIEVSSQALCRKLPNGVTENNHISRPFSVTHFLNDHDVINLGGRQLEIIRIPGHTPDSIALIDRKAKLLWTGDSYYSGPIWLYAPETDLSEYAKALEKLIKEIPNVKALLPAHNTPWVDPKILLEVKKGFHAMLAGQTQQIELGDGMVEHRIANQNTFSFLMSENSLRKVH